MPRSRCSYTYYCVGLSHNPTASQYQRTRIHSNTQEVIWKILFPRIVHPRDGGGTEVVFDNSKLDPVLRMHSFPLSALSLLFMKIYQNAHVLVRTARTLFPFVILRFHRRRKTAAYAERQSAKLSSWRSSEKHDEPNKAGAIIDSMFRPCTVELHRKIIA